MRHIPFIIFISFLFIFLSVRAQDEYRFSDWQFGDAQTILTLHQWEKEGWLKSKLLATPQGYAKAIYILDEPALRHHAHGICPTSSPEVGSRLRYTHYPSGYLIPYGLLFKLGLKDTFFLKMLSVVFSVGALILMYALLSKITSPTVASIAVIFYSLTTAFLGYADSLANQPWDDLLRFASMLFVVLGQRRIFLVWAWIIQFVLSLSSYDSVIFVYLWLILWDFLQQRRFRWRLYLMFALAPLCGRILQLLQNAWYLGFSAALTDIKDIFLQKSVFDKGLASGLILSFKTTVETLHNLYHPTVIILLMLILYGSYSLFVKKGKDIRGLPSYGLLLTLFLCGIGFILILPEGAKMKYEMRQMAPFMSVLVGGFTVSFFREIKPRTQPVYLALAGIVLVAFGWNFIRLDRKPMYHNHIIKDHPDIVLAQGIRTLATKYDAIIFSIEGFQSYWDPNYQPGHPQIQPVTEYFTGLKPILTFIQPAISARDLLYMLKNSRYKFSPVLVAYNRQYIEEVVSILYKEGVLKDNPSAPYIIAGRYVLVLNDGLKWGRAEE